MRTVALYEMILGVLSLAGGAVGYATDGDWTTVVIGVIAGLVLIGAALKMQKGARTGMHVSLIVSLLLFVASGWNYLHDQAGFFPSGLLATMSLVSLLLILLLLVQPKKRERIF